MSRRRSTYPQRKKLQEQRLKLPLFPTTTIGSFPQTKEVRTVRAEYKAGKRDDASYESFLRTETEKAVRVQEDTGLDVLVHGEFERNDRVEYFAEQVPWFTGTKKRWCKNNGSHCVSPPTLYCD